jgi:hypothetical protein
MPIRVWFSRLGMVAALIWVIVPVAAPSQGQPASCQGDCDQNGSVSVDELIKAVSVALGAVPLTVCPAADADGDGNVTVSELVASVDAALQGCQSPSATSTPSPTPIPSECPFFSLFEGVDTGFITVHRPRIAMRPTGEFTAVFGLLDLVNGNTIVLQSYDSQARRVREASIMASAVMLTGNAELAQGSSGSTLVIWEEAVRSAVGPFYVDHVTARRFDTSLVASGPRHILDQFGVLGPLASTAGHAIAIGVQKRDPLQPFTPFALRIGPDGEPLGSPISLAPRCVSVPDVAVASQGNFALVCTAGIEPMIFAQRFDVSGQPLGDGFRVDVPIPDSMLQYAMLPRIAMDSDGGFVVVWHKRLCASRVSLTL